MAAAGVAYLAWWNGAAPWIALILGTTFSVYGLIRKLMPLDAVTPFTDEGLETAIRKLSGRVPMRVAEHEIVLRGACPSCVTG